MKHSTRLHKITLVFIFSTLMGCSLFHPFKKEPKLKNIYAVLKIECQERNLINNYDHVARGMNRHMLSCCLDSVEEMEKHGYKEATWDNNNKLTCKEKETHLMQFKCPGTLAWCEREKKR